MTGGEPPLARAVRRLTRLFRIERKGGFDHRPPALIARLLERRGALVARLILDLRHRPMAETSFAELERSLTALVPEVERTLDHARARLEEIRNDLRLSRGEGLPTGIRNSTNGQSLGKI